MGEIVFHAEIFREDDLYVGICRELNVSSFGDSVDEAKHSLYEAVEAFIEECKAMGTLEEVMEEAGFIQEQGTWIPRRPVAEELLSIK
jgi:predicted RNase H-like HicB family nuclease